MKPRTHVAWMRRLQRFAPLIAGTAMIANAPSAFAAIVGGMSMYVVTRWATRAISQRWWQALVIERHEQLDAAHDVRALQAPLDDLAELYAAAGVPSSDVGLAIMNTYGLLIAERFAEARVALAAIDLEQLDDARTRALVENNLAWAMAHDHAAAPAERLAQQALDRLRDVEQSPNARRLVASCLGTLGVAHTLAGDHEAAIEPITQALSHGGSPRSQQIRWFYLGLAFEGLGRTAEAIDAWTNSTSLLPETRYGLRAADRLARLG